MTVPHVARGLHLVERPGRRLLAQARTDTAVAALLDGALILAVLAVVPLERWTLALAAFVLCALGLFAAHVTRRR